MVTVVLVDNGRPVVDPILNRDIIPTPLSPNLSIPGFPGIPETHSGRNLPSNRHPNLERMLPLSRP